MVLHCERCFPIIGNVNDYVTNIYSKYADFDGNNKTCGPGWEVA